MATTRRFFVENIGRETLLTDEAYRHAKSVLRLHAGDEVVLFDGSGKEYTAIVNAEQRGALLCNVLVRVSESYALEMHIDVEEANALGVKTGDRAFFLED